MTPKSKIKITDNPETRSEIYQIYQSKEQIAAAKWAIECAKHVLPLLKVENIDTTVIEDGFEINELWQDGKATVHEVRQAGLKTHAIARKCKTEIGKSAVRTAGHAIGVGHMKEHAMVCSDYAIKTIELAFPNEKERIINERKWQLIKLKEK